MAKYGRGLNREIVGAVNQGIIIEPFSVADIPHFTQKCAWDIPVEGLGSDLKIEIWWHP